MTFTIVRSPSAKYSLYHAEKLATEIFVKLCSIAVIWRHSLVACGLVAQMEVGWLAQEGTDSSRLNQESGLLEFSKHLTKLAVGDLAS